MSQTGNGTCNSTSCSYLRKLTRASNVLVRAGDLSYLYCTKAINVIASYEQHALNNGVQSDDNKNSIKYSMALDCIE